MRFFKIGVRVYLEKTGDSERPEPHPVKNVATAVTYRVPLLVGCQHAGSSRGLPVYPGARQISKGEDYPFAW